MLGSRIFGAWPGVALAVACAGSACGDDQGQTGAPDASADAEPSADAGAGPYLTADASAGPERIPDASAGPGAPPPLQNALAPLVTPTYDGSGQAVEPTVLYFAQGWQGHHYWMAVSPYPYSNASLENPSILVSEDGLSWSVPDGLTNPLALPSSGTLSDATLFHDKASDELWVYYLGDVKVNGVDQQSMQRLTSPDGLHWSAPEPILSGESYPIQSPSVLKIGDTFVMWTVDAGPEGCLTQSTTVHRRTSRDGVHWTRPKPVNVTQPGYVIWHLNMTQVPVTGQLLSLLSAYPRGAVCGAASLFLAESDGQDWKTYAHALLSPGHDWDNQEIYRSSLLYDPVTTKLRVWYSGRQLGTNTWHLGYTEGLRPLH